MPALKKPPVDPAMVLIAGTMKARGMTPRDLAKPMGVSEKTAYTRFRGSVKNWKLSELLGACRALGIPLNEMRRVITY